MATNQSELNVSNLKDIIKALKQGYFPSYRWSPLGLQLGLLHPTLSSIRTKYRDDPESCLQECLTLWLSKADKVTENGGPTWDSLADALKTIEEVFAAEQIKEFNELSNLAYQILQRHFDRISPLTLPVGIIQMLYEERVISKETLDEVNRLGGVLGEGPLRALCTTVYEDPNKLKVFANVLLKSEEIVQIAKDILKKNEKTFPSQVNLQRTYTYDFDQMIMTFESLIEAVSPLIETGIPSLKNLKTYLQRCFQELRPQLSLAKSFDDVMELVQDNCTITNICCLETIVNHYKITAAKPYIEEFKTAVDTFCEKIKTDICSKQNFKIASFSHHLTCETIEFDLEWETNEYRLRHIKNLLAKAFEDMAKSVQVRTIYGERFDKAMKLEVRSNEAINEELKVVLQQKQREIDDLVSTKEALEEELQAHKTKILEMSSVTESKESELKQLLETSTEMNRAKILQVEQLTNTIKEKEVFEKELLSVSVERQREIETLQETITTLTLQLRERDKQIEELKQSLKESELKQLLETSTKMNRAKIVQIEQLTNTIKRKETTEKELLSASAERERELDTLQEIVTSLTLQLREKEKQIEELKQSLKDLAFIPKVHKQLTDKIIEDTSTECSLENDNEVSNLSAVQITEKELLSVSNSEHNNYEKTLKLELRERDKQIEELKQSLKEMKQSNIEDFSSFLTEREVTIEDHLQEESTQSSERDKLIEELQQSVLLKALDLTVIPKAQNLINIEELKEMQTMAKEKDSILSKSEEIGLLDIQDKVNVPLQVSNEKCIQCDHWNSPNISDLFKGMMPVGKKVCLYKTDSDHELTVDECGLRLIIPAEVIKPTEFVDEYEVAAQGLWGGKFEFPKGSKLISGVCYVSISTTSVLDKQGSSVLDKAVTVELEHCATIIDERQSQYLSFVIADHKSGPPFKFKKLSGGCFFPNSQIGSISIKSFSIVAIVLLTVVGVAGDGMAGAVAGGMVGGVVGGMVSTAAAATVVLAAGAFIGSKIERQLTTYHNVTCSYKGHVFYKRENPRKWSCNFVVTQNNKYSDSFLEDFFGKIHYSFGFCFTKTNLELKGFPSENRKIHGWTIIPHIIPTIIKVRDVDEFSSSEQAKPPSISMGITAHPGDSDFKEDFQYPLTVEGIDCGKEKNIKDFVLGYIIPSQCKIVIDISLSDNTHIILNTCPDENELLDLLASIDSDWYKIGKALKVSHNTLEGLSHNNESNTVKLEKVIHSWITTQSSPITWETVIDAIDGNIVNNRAKVNEIREHLRLPN